MCMEHVLSPITSCEGLGVAIVSTDGIWCHCHPILAAFVGDYPEQALVTCMYNGRCSKCQVPDNQLGEYSAFPPCVQTDALSTYHLANGDVPAIVLQSSLKLDLVFNPNVLKLHSLVCSSLPSISELSLALLGDSTCPPLSCLNHHNNLCTSHHQGPCRDLLLFMVAVTRRQCT